MTRVAAIDCGTNTIRLLVAEAHRDDSGRPHLEVLRRRNEIVRLGQGVDRTGLLDPEALERTLAAVASYAADCAELGVAPGGDVRRFVATSATRDARNREDFVAGVRRLLGIEPEVVSGQEEARLSFTGSLLGARESADGGAAPRLVVDLGGGSTEFVVGSHGGPISGSYSAQMGCVRLSERIMRSNPATAEEVTQADAYVAEQLARVRADVPIGSTRTLVGCAGTFTTLSALAQGLETYDSHAIHGSVLRFDALRVLTAQLIRESSEQLSINPVIHPGRADVIAGGAVVVNGIMALLAEEADVHTMTISEKDILDGIIAELAGE